MGKSLKACVFQTRVSLSLCTGVELCFSPSLNVQSLGPQQNSCVVCAASRILDLGRSPLYMYILGPTTRRCIAPGFLNLCLVEIVAFDFPARAVHVQSPMHGVHIWPEVLVWTPETLRASQNEKNTSVLCCLYLSADNNALAYNSGGGWRG